MLKLHSQVGGFVAVLQVSALSKQLDELRHEHAGCPSSSVVFTQDLPGPHGADELSVLKLHSHVGGLVAALQVSALSRHVAESKQEHAGCPGISVTLRHIWLGPHTSKRGKLKLHSQVGGFVVLLQVSALSKHCEASRQEHAGWPGSSVIFRHILPVSQGANDGVFALH